MKVEERERCFNNISYLLKHKRWTEQPGRPSGKNTHLFLDLQLCYFRVNWDVYSSECDQFLSIEGLFKPPRKVSNLKLKSDPIKGNTDLTGLW